MQQRTTIRSERPSVGLGVAAVVVGVGSLVLDSIARLRHRSDAHREAPASNDAPMVVPAFDFEHELERLLASAGRTHAHA